MDAENDSAISQKMKNYKNNTFLALVNGTRLFFRNGGSIYLRQSLFVGVFDSSKLY